MKQKLYRIAAVIMAAVIIASLAAGCKKDDDDPNAPEIPEFVYVPSYIELPEGIEDMQNLMYWDGKLYFTSSTYEVDDEWNYTWITTINTMNIDGTDYRTLENFISGEPEVEGAQGNVWLNALRVDGQGNIWVSESGNFWRYNLPEDYDPEFDGPEWEYYEDMGNLMLLRKLDQTGAEIKSVDISNLQKPGEYFYMQTFNIDDEGNIIIGAGEALYIIDESGRQLFTIDLQNRWVDQLIRLADGRIAYFGYAEGGRVLRPIDMTTRGLGDEIEIPYNAYYLYQGGGEYDLVYSDNINLYGIDRETSEPVKLLNWINSDILLDGMEALTLLPDGRILCVNRTYNRADWSMKFELIIMTKVPYESVPEKIILVMATMSLDWNLRTAIVNFNKSNDTYRIQVNDYQEYATQDDWQAGLTKLSTEIISGRVPDILDVRGLPHKQYVAKGLLEDLYPFIDNDPRLSRSDLMEGIFRAAELDGKLYQIFSNFMISTLVGSPRVLGSNPGWNMDEFRAVLRDNPQSDMPLGQWNTKTNFLEQAIITGIDNYVDWVAGKCDFDNDTFAGLLEFANSFPDEINWNNFEETYVDESELIATGRQIMVNTSLYNFNTFTMYKAMFGDELVFKGFPTEDRNGNSISIDSGLAITTRCRDKDGAWQFIRTILTEEWQRNNVWGFGTNKNFFYEKMEEEMTPWYYTDEFGNEVEGSKGGIGWGDFMVEIFAMTQEEADQILGLIESVTGTQSYDQVLLDIIKECAADYFNGRHSARDAARVIQSRASIYIAEQT